MSAVTVVGNLALDRIDGGAPRPGGAPYHAARALRVLAADGRVVARCAPQDRDALLSPLVELGVPVTWLPATSTAAFTIAYDGESRTVTPETAGDPWTPADVAGVAPGWVQAGALAASDFPADTLAALAQERRVLLDGQALARPVGAFDLAALRHVTVLKLADDEAEALFGERAERELEALAVPEVLLTLGRRGTVVLAGGRRDHVDARAVDADPTGAGDMLCAAYLAGRARGDGPLAAAQHAAGVVSEVLAAS